LSRTLFQNNPVLIHCLKGAQILIDHGAGDENGTRAAITSPMYKQFLVQMDLPERVNVLDFGANARLRRKRWGLPAYARVERHSHPESRVRLQKVACVEFNPSTYSRLCFNVERNIPAEFVGFNVAVCAEKKEFELALGSGGTSDSLYK